nr:golgin subfamily A member 6-like protein 4 [Nicotiana tomentosiformis]
MDLWIKAAGGVYKERVYGLGSELSSSHRSFRSGGSSSSRSLINQDEFELLNRRIAEITELYAQERSAREEEAKRRKEEDRRREEEERRRKEEMRQKDAAFTRVTGDVESLKAQLNSLLASGAFPLPHSPSRSNKTKE